MAVYYNDADPAACAWLRGLIAAGFLPAGEVDARSILEVEPADLWGFTQCHFFAGIGGWPHALRLAGVAEDRPVWTGSPPCQPFSQAGQRKGQNDDRHLAPAFLRLVAACSPELVFGEQVASAAVLGPSGRTAGTAAEGPAGWVWFGAEIAALDAQIAELSKESRWARLLQTMPGVGPITAMAIEAFAPPMETFRRGRDFAAWLGLVPRQSSSGGKARLGKVSKAGQHDIRRLLVVGAMAAIVGACRRGIPEDTWLGKLMLRKPRILVAIALANKMARRIWAMLTKGESYRDPALAAA